MTTAADNSPMSPTESVVTLHAADEVKKDHLDELAEAVANTAETELAIVLGALMGAVDLDKKAETPPLELNTADIMFRPENIDVAAANMLASPSEPTTPVPGHPVITLPADKNMADYVTPPTPGAPPSQSSDANLDNLGPVPEFVDPDNLPPNTLSPREQEKADEGVLKGMHAFFNNQYAEAKAIFRSRANGDPLYALGLGAMDFIQALSTSDPVHTESAISTLTKIYKFTGSQISAASANRSLKDTVSHYITNVMGTNTTGMPTNTPPLRPGELKQHPEFIPNGALRAHVIRAESCLLMAMIYLFQETAVGYLKAGLNLRRAYSSYSLVWQEYKRMGQEFQRYMDRDTISGIQFGIGSVHLLLSSIPPKILKIVSAFGWKADKQLGFALLKLCLDGQRIRSPLAALMLLFYYTTQMSQCPLLLTHYMIQPAIEILLGAQNTFPNSGFFLYFAGRIARLSRNTTLSSQSFTYSYNANQGEWAVATIGQLAQQEMIFNCAVSLDWASAALRTVDFQNKHPSPAFWRYFYGACMEMLGDRTEAILAFAEVPKLISKKNPTEAFLSHRVAFFELSGYQDMDFSMPVFEVMYLWNLFPTMKPDALERCLQLIDGTLSAIYQREKIEYEVRAIELAPNLDPPNYYDQRAILLLIKSCISTCLTRCTDAIVHLNWIIDHKDRIAHSKWVVPYAYWESGMVSWFMKDFKRARALWEHALTFSGYDFEYALAFQLNLAIGHATDLGILEGTSLKPYTGPTTNGRKRMPIASTTT